MSNALELRLVIEDDEDLEAATLLAWDIHDLTVEATGQADDGRFHTQFEPITTLAVLGTVTIAAKFVLDWWEKRKGGLVLDQRPEKIEIHRDKALPWGYVVIYAKDGNSVQVDTKDMPKDSLQQFLDSIIGGLVKSASDIAEVAKSPGRLGSVT